MPKFLLRLDDACPTMNKQNWDYVEKILKKYDIKPIVGVIPNNQDKAQLFNKPINTFWHHLLSLEQLGWEIAMHGYNHVYSSCDSGINPFHNRSEFAGLSLEVQLCKISNGIKIFHEKNIYPKVFIAPSHTFDLNTIKAIKQNNNLKIISDTIAFRPYIEHEILFIPQQFGLVRNIPLPGLWTFCYHPSTMTINQFNNLELFLSKNASKFTNINEVVKHKYNENNIWNKIYKQMYFFQRRIKNI